MKLQISDRLIYRHNFRGSRCQPPSHFIATMTTSTTVDHKRIVALNNIGVTLLERKSYSKAENHFRDVLGVLKCSLGPQNENTRVLMEAKLHDAIRLLPINDAENCKNDSCQQSIMTLRNDMNFAYMKQLLEKGPSAMLGAFMRISEVQCTCCEQSRSSDTECAIILYNFGLAYYFQYKQENEKAYSTTLLQSCSKLFEFTMNALTMRAGTDYFQLCNLYFIRSVVLANHWHVLSEAGDTESAACAAAHFQENRTTALFLINDIPFGHCPLGASAA